MLIIFLCIIVNMGLNSVNDHISIYGFYFSLNTVESYRGNRGKISTLFIMLQWRREEGNLPQGLGLKEAPNYFENVLYTLLFLRNRKYLENAFKLIFVNIENDGSYFFGPVD